MSDGLYAVQRKYYSIMLFRNQSFWDVIEDNSWELYGLGIRDKSTLVKDDLVNVQGWTARCDLSRGRFSRTMNDVTGVTNCLSIINAGGYLRLLNPLNIDNNCFTISCWFRLRPEYMARYTKNDKRVITLCGWKDNNGEEISIDIYAKDLDHPYEGVPSLKIHYGNDVITRLYSDDPGMFHTNWRHFSFQHTDSMDCIHIDGIKVLEIDTTKYSIGSTISDLKIGAYKPNSSGGIEIDDFVVLNDYISTENEYKVPSTYLFYEYPEVYHEEDLRSTKNIYYKTANLFGLEFKTYTPTSKDLAGVIRFNADTSESILGLFANNTYMDPSRYTGAANVITLTNAEDKTKTLEWKFTLVTIAQKDNANNFYLSVEQTTGTGTRFIDVPNMEGKRNDDDAFLIFDGSLALVQKNRYYREIVDDDEHPIDRIVLTSQSDSLINENGHITFIFIRRNTTDGVYKDYDGLEINFFKIQGRVYERGKVRFPKYDNFVAYSNSNMIFFVNGTYMPPSSYTLNGEILTLTDTDTQNLQPNSNVTAICMLSNKINEEDEVYPSLINGSGAWDVLLDNLTITRSSTYVPPNTADIAMYDKIQWYKNDEIPIYNFTFYKK